MTYGGSKARESDMPNLHSGDDEARNMEAWIRQPTPDSRYSWEKLLELREYKPPFGFGRRKGLTKGWYWVISTWLYGHIDYYFHNMFYTYWYRKDSQFTYFKRTSKL